MIFPDLPKHYQWIQHSPEMIQHRTANIQHTETNVEPCTAKAPLRQPKGITVEEWFDQHGYSRDPAAGSSRYQPEPIDWWAKDAWEFYALCVTMICWTVYWYGVHMGAW